MTQLHIHLKTKLFLPLLLVLLGFNTKTIAQHEELKQKITAFVESKANEYDKKYLNEKEPEYGDLKSTNFEFHDFFMLKAKEKTVNSIGNNSKLKLDFSFYGYENLEERNYALSFWFKNFMEAKRITPGRQVRTYKGAWPTIVIINEKDICILSYTCIDDDPDLFRAWRKEMLTFFGDAESMVIEVSCDGPLDWTKNPPDPKDPAWRK